ncbi:MAG: putative phosphoribosyltransferase [Candidatus Scalindua rubra]|uniref:Putative phosphoribosyltransferase n=1 Tax=Candidatus Scalindua rubra TaxID=1872076 RepID=A0A1E3XBZ6_9BACT|nr:MAG: putative phosphoribosyltransferase [Candidatus Scalindua rubra]
MLNLHQENKTYVLTAIRNTFSGLLDILYPRYCFACDNSLHEEGNTYICKNCLEEIKKTDAKRCVKCGFELGIGITSSNKGCPECENSNLRFEKSFFISDNKGALKNLIHQFKYNKHMCLVKPLGDLLINLLIHQDIMPEIDIVAPVPLHWRKKLERGFNQSELLAKKVCKKLSLPISTSNLCRIKNTLSQTQLSRTQRQKNVNGAFKIKNPKLFFKKKALLIDDVLTTGITASECARNLKKCGS